jgi:hypothetical protein
VRTIGEGTLGPPPGVNGGIIPHGSAHAGEAASKNIPVNTNRVNSAQHRPEIKRMGLSPQADSLHNADSPEKARRPADVYLPCVSIIGQVGGKSQVLVAGYIRADSA